MYPIKLEKEGKLGEALKPAILLDAGFTRYYKDVEGMGSFDDITINADTETMQPAEIEQLKYFCDLASPENQNGDFIAIRNIAINCLSTASLVVTPLTVLGLIRTHSKKMYEQLCSDSIGVAEVKRIGDRGTAESLSKLLNKYREDANDKAAKELLENCSLNMSFVKAHGLQGTFYASDLPIKITDSDIGCFLWELALVQFSTSEIINIHTAKLIGCEYIATMSTNIISNKNLIEEVAGITVLGSPKELLDVLHKHHKGGSNE